MDAWLEDPYFIGWLSKIKNDKSKARCTLWHKTIELSTSGQSALTDYAKLKKHGDLALKRKKIFKSKFSEAFIPTLKLAMGISKHWKILSLFFSLSLSQNDSSKVEIIWILEVCKEWVLSSLQ